eukprot:scaffold379254_cov19-Prasinocladus_malaysianus.AAC.1
MKRCHNTQGMPHSMSKSFAQNNISGATAAKECVVLNFVGLCEYSGFILCVGRFQSSSRLTSGAAAVRMKMCLDLRANPGSWHEQDLRGGLFASPGYSHASV